MNAPTSSAPEALRNDITGQYAHSLERVCKCGRRKGVHAASAPYPFEAWELEEEGKEGPECERFRAVKAKKAA